MFTPSQKAEIVRRHLKDQVPVSELATEHNLQPGRTHQWIAAGLTQLERAFEKPGKKPKRSAGKLEQFIAKDFKIFMRIFGLTHVRTSPYYPQSNGKLEAAREQRRARRLAARREEVASLAG